MYNSQMPKHRSPCWPSAKPLLFALIFISARVQSNEFLCKKPLVESYGIFSYTAAAREKMILCPSIKATCCPAWEQFKLYQNYHKVVKPYFKVFEQVISKSLMLLKDRVNKFFDLNIPEKISKMQSKSGQLLMGDKFNSINNQDRILVVLTEMESRLPTTLEYMDHLKSLFFCTICGYGNQQFIDIPTKSVSFSSESCDSLVRNTFQFAYLMNNLLLPFIMGASEFMVKAMKNKEHKVLKLKPLTIISKAVDECAKDYRDMDEGLNNCLAYCSFFKLNRNTPEIEGYPELFFNFLVQVDAFIATGGTIVEKKPPAKKPAKTPEPPKEDNKTKPKLKMRILEQLLSDDQFQRVNLRILEAEQAAKENEAGGEKKAEPEDFHDVFDPANMMKALQEGNIFDDNGVDPNMDDAAMAQALSLQVILSEENNVDDLDVIIRKHIADSYLPEIEDIDTLDIFSRPVNEKVHLDKFQSKFGFNGIDFTHNMQKTNWDASMHSIVASLKGKKDNGPTNDHLDLKVIEVANSVNNKFLIRFHRDNFKVFEGTHVHQPNHVIKDLRNYIIDKNNEEYARTTQRLENLLENTQDPAATAMFKTKLASAEKKFAYKVAVSMSRIDQRLDNTDLTQLREIDERIQKANIDQLVELQADLFTMQDKCAGEKRKTQHCRVAYNKLADLFDIDPLLPDLHNDAQEMLNIQLKYKVKDRMESIEDLKKDEASLDKLEAECAGEKQLTPDCQDKLFEYGVIYQVDPTLPTFFADLDKKIAEFIKKAEDKAKAPDAAGGEGEGEGAGAEGGDAASGGDAPAEGDANSGS